MFGMSLANIVFAMNLGLGGLSCGGDWDTLPRPETESGFVGPLLPPDVVPVEPQNDPCIVLPDEIEADPCVEPSEPKDPELVPTEPPAPAASLFTQMIDAVRGQIEILRDYLVNWDDEAAMYFEETFGDNKLEARNTCLDLIDGLLELFDQLLGL